MATASITGIAHSWRWKLPVSMRYCASFSASEIRPSTLTQTYSTMSTESFHIETATICSPHPRPSTLASQPTKQEYPYGKGDITKLTEATAIVNAANSALLTNGRTIDHHLDMVRNWPESALYGSLKKIANRFGDGKRCFIQTSNPDGLFLANGFHPSRISTPQGQYAYLQCFVKCRPEEVFPSAPVLNAALPHLDPVTQELDDLSKVPVCKHCGEELTICIRGGDYFNDAPFRAHEREYRRFVGHVSSAVNVEESRSREESAPAKAIILELGVGMNTPSVLRWPNERLVEESNGGGGFRLIRAGLDASGCARWELEERWVAVGIYGDLSGLFLC
ncbi:uncharacterized protein BDV17DRAFT_289647 [Aspergillus undulatus]|uniref:uncharacterized protein n=1 Tax=Aspergillus undulatus TaxID=1810928 RepID=UPI003CCCD086